MSNKHLAEAQVAYDQEEYGQEEIEWSPGEDDCAAVMVEAH